MIPFHNRKYLNVFAVGVGLRDDKAKQEVRDMVRSPANALLTESFEQLTESVDDFLIRFCPGNYDIILHKLPQYSDLIFVLTLPKCSQVSSLQLFLILK